MANYLREPYSADLDFGTGEWSVGSWVNIPYYTLLNFPEEPKSSAMLSGDSSTFTGGNGSWRTWFGAGSFNAINGKLQISTTSGLYLRLESPSLTSGKKYLATAKIRVISGICTGVKTYSVDSIGIQSKEIVPTVDELTYTFKFSYITNPLYTPLPMVALSVLGNCVVEVDDFQLYELQDTTVTGPFILSRSHPTGTNLTLQSDWMGKLVATASDGTTTRTVTTDAAYNTGSWLKAEATYRAGKLAILVNGQEVKSTVGAPLLSLNSRYNQLTYSEQFDNAVWMKNNSRINFTNILSPLGTLTATELEFTGTSGSIYRPSPISIQPNTQYIHTVWMRAKSGTFKLKLSRTNGATWSTATVSNEITLTETWTQYSITYTTGATDTGSDFVIGAESKTPYTLPATGAIYIWGAQLETGTTAKTYQRVGAATDFDFQAPLTIGNSYDLTAPFPGSLALVKLSATVPTAEQALWMYNQEKQMFQPNAQVTLPDSNAIQDISYDDLTDTWVAASTTNTSYWNGLVRTNSVAVPAGTYSRLVSGSGMHLSARITTNQGVDITIPDYKVRTKIKKKSEKSKKNSTTVFDYTPVQFTNAVLNGTNIMTCSTVSGTPYIGMTISGTGITPGTTILGINGTSYYLSTNATAGTVTVGQTSFDLPVGYTANLVYSNGSIKREASTKDWTRAFDGFKETVIFGTSPGNVSVQIHCQTS